MSLLPSGAGDLVKSNREKAEVLVEQPQRQPAKHTDKEGYLLSQEPSFIPDKLSQNLLWRGIVGRRKKPWWVQDKKCDKKVTFQEKRSQQQPYQKLLFYAYLCVYTKSNLLPT